jgi:hypothetical protein
MDARGTWGRGRLVRRRRARAAGGGGPGGVGIMIPCVLGGCYVGGYRDRWRGWGFRERRTCGGMGGLVEAIAWAKGLYVPVLAALGLGAFVGDIEVASLCALGVLRHGQGGTTQPSVTRRANRQDGRMSGADAVEEQEKERKGRKGGAVWSL